MADAPQVWIKTFKNLNVDNYLAKAFGQTIYNFFSLLLSGFSFFLPKEIRNKKNLCGSLCDCLDWCLTFRYRLFSNCVFVKQSANPAIVGSNNAGRVNPQEQLLGLVSAVVESSISQLK